MTEFSFWVIFSVSQQLNHVPFSIIFLVFPKWLFPKQSLSHRLLCLCLSDEPFFSWPSFPCGGRFSSGGLGFQAECVFWVCAVIYLLLCGWEFVSVCVGLLSTWRTVKPPGPNEGNRLLGSHFVLEASGHFLVKWQNRR